jgi:hypothetical protein
MDVNGGGAGGAVQESDRVRFDDRLDGVVLTWARGVVAGDPVADGLANRVLKRGAQEDDHRDVEQEEHEAEERHYNQAYFDYFSATLPPPAFWRHSIISAKQRFAIMQLRRLTR